MTISQPRYKGHVIIIFILFLILLVFRLSHTIYWIASLINQGARVESILFDHKLGNQVNFEINTDKNCPLNFSISGIRVFLSFESKGNESFDENILAKFHISNIDAKKGISKNYSGNVKLDKFNFTTLSKFSESRKLNISLHMHAKCRFIMIPMAFSIKTTVYRLDISRISKKRTISVGNETLELTGDICEDVNMILKKDLLSTFKVTKVRHSISELRREAIKSELYSQESYNSVLLKDVDSDFIEKSFYQFEITAKNPVKTDYIREVDVKIENRKIEFAMPFRSFLILKRLRISNVEGSIVILIPDFEEDPFLFDGALTFFETQMLTINIESFSSIIDKTAFTTFENELCLVFPLKMIKIKEQPKSVAIRFSEPTEK